MKTTGKGLANPEVKDYYRVMVSKISISVKFCCRLYLEYCRNGQIVKSGEIKIDPKERNYSLEEEVKWQKLGEGQDSQISVFVKLLSSKGIAFTAGILNLSGKELPHHSVPFNVKLSKSLDPESYCECRCSFSQSNKQLPDSQVSIGNLSLASLKAQSQSLLNEQLKGNIKQLSRELESVKAAYEMLKLKKMEEVDASESRSEKELIRQLKKHRQLLEQSRARQVQLQKKNEFLQGEILKANAALTRQKEIIFILETAQKTTLEERAEFKAQLKTGENDLEEKRRRISELEGQKFTLMMEKVTVQKQIGFLKERVQESISKTYGVVRKLKQQKNETNRSSSVHPKFASFSCSVEPKEGEQSSYKLALPVHKYLTREQLPWYDQTQAFKQQLGSQIEPSAMNDISISHINSKLKSQVSLLNSELFIKGNSAATKLSVNQILKGISDYVRTYCSKMEKIISECFASQQKECLQLRKKCRFLSENNNQFERNQYSLLNQLEQLQGGLECQLAVVMDRDQALTDAKESIFKLEEQVAESDRVIKQLEAAVNILEEDRQELRKELHENNYVYAQREEQMLLALNKGQLSPCRRVSISPPLQKSRQKSPFIKQTQREYERELISYRQQIKTLELQLSHQRKQASELKVALDSAEMQKHRFQFALKLRERMQVLNRSIQVSRQQSQGEGEGTKQSRGKCEQQFAKLFVE